MAKFLSPLIYKPISDKLFELTSECFYESDLLNKTIVIPCGFITDGPSVPRLPLVYLIWGDRAKEPSVLHDWLYALQATDRKTADDLLYESSMVCNIPGWIRDPYYLGVRLGGWKAWNEDKKTQVRWRGYDSIT